MLRRALPRAGHLDFLPVQGDVHALPFTDASFDGAILHLILAVVPDPERCLGEIARLVRPGGQVLVFDKFLRHGQPAFLRRLANPLMRRVATRLDVIFEDVLATTPTLVLENDRPALAGGWFRLIRLRRL
jgi:ubiquinone/menaquinone biosynthesis C-methylase UbiE